AACAATKETIRTGLSYWEAKGELTIGYQEEQIKLERVFTKPNSESEKLYKSSLNDYLEETQSYRNFFQSGELNNLFPSLTT
ncbi:hypothetical protein, partial [Vibrio sp.]|uniref:hypothetical protein n=1 Tax=Vibrio sp. TaxID=678 RepID=UPI003D0D817C